MRLLRVEAEGFGSHAEYTEVPWDNSLTFICGRNLDTPGLNNNASGKTTLLDMAIWSLYSRTPNNRSKDRVINDYKDEVKVTSYFEGLTVRRSKKRNKSEKLAFHIPNRGWVATEEDDIGVAEEKLQRFLGFSFDMFCNSTFLGRSSKTTEFLTAKPKERLAVFSQIINMARYEAAATLVKEDLKELKDQQRDLESYLRVMQNQEVTLRKELAELQKSLSEAREKAETSKRSLTGRIRELEKEAKELIESVADAPTDDMQELQKQKVEYKKRLEAVKEDYHNYKAKFESSHELEEGDTCPTCLRELSEGDAIQAAEDRDNLQKLVEHKKTEAKELAHLIQSLEVKQEDLRSFKTKQRLAESRVSEIRMEIKLLRDEMLPPDVTRLSGLLDEKRAWLQENLEESRQKREELANLIPKYETGKLLRQAFTQDIRNMLLDKVRRGLEYYTNLYLKILTKGEYRISFPHTTSTGQEKFEILLKDGIHERDLSCFSGGESWRASFAILLAMRSVLDERKNNPFSFLMIDDPFGPLDKSGKKEFLELIEKVALEGKIPQIMVAVPTDEELREGSNVLWVEKQHKISRLKV